jgi:dipeptidyl aminopeptidase/acylaminoacyl peptidase
LLGFACQATFAGSLVKISELDLDSWSPKEVSSTQRFPVFALSFSPDGKRIALVGAETLVGGGALTSRLLVSDVGGAAVKVFEVPYGGAAPAWSPSGDAIVTSGLLIQLSTGTTCKLPWISQFVAEDEIIGYTRPAPPGPRPSQFTLFGRSCQPKREWETPEEWYLADVSVDRRLLLISSPHIENLLVDPEDGHVVRRWSAGRWPLFDAPHGDFADDGKAVCGTLSVSDAPKGQTLRCWNVDTGEVIGNALADYAATPFATSMKSTRVVFSEFGYARGLTRDGDAHPYRGAVVWDFATAQRLASWRPETQTYMENGLRPPRRITEPSKVAVSPDGQFVAEAGNGRLTVYRVQR